MKFLEKMAKDSENALVDTPREPESYDWGRPYTQGFIAGFRAAREMIRERIRDELGSDEALKTIGFPSNIGEEEVQP